MMRRWQYGGNSRLGVVAGRDTCCCTCCGTGCVCCDVRQYDGLDGRALALTVDRRCEAGRKVVGRNPPGLVLNRLVLNRLVLNRPFEIGHSFSGPFRGTVILRGSSVTQRMIIVMIIILRNCRGALFDLRVLCLSFLGLRLSRCRYRCRSGSPTQQPCLHGDDQAGELLHAHQP